MAGWQNTSWRLQAAALAALIGLSISLPIAAAQKPSAAATAAVVEVRALGWQAEKLFREGKYEEAIGLAERALAKLEPFLDTEDPRLAAPLNQIGAIYQEKGDYLKAESLFKRALTIGALKLGPQHTEVMRTLELLATLYGAMGDYDGAETLYQRVLPIREKTQGRQHPATARTLEHLAMLYDAKGDYGQAEPLHQRALAIRERAMGPRHAEVAESLHNFALHCQAKGDYDRAEKFYQRALAIGEQALGPDDPNVATALHNLALLYQAKGDAERAEPLFDRALAIHQQSLGPEHPSVATALTNLAALHQSKGGYDQAERLYQRALAIHEKSLGPQHAFTAASQVWLALLYYAKGDTARALASLTRAQEIIEHNLTLILALGSEGQKRAYMAALSGVAHATFSLHAREMPEDTRAARLALTTALRYKGRALDALTDSLQILRRNFSQGERALFNQLANVRAQLATLMLRGPGRIKLAEYRAQITKLLEQERKLEALVSERGADFRAQLQPVTLELVQPLIPEGTALIEIVSYRPFNAGRAKETWGEARYAAYVARRTGEPAGIDLGEAAAIDRGVDNLRRALRDRESDDVKPLARALDEQVMRPIRKLLGETRAVLLAPDGALNLLPFAALVDEQDRYLVEQYSFTYLTSGRDLLRLQARLPSAQGPMIIADPDFGEPPTREAKREAARSFDLSQAVFTPLPGTAEEARALKVLLPQATVLTRGQATEAALKQAASPSILHVATHGFFLEDAVAGPPPAPSGRLLQQQTVPGQPAAPGLRLQNPLLRSGLGLAGANPRKSGNDDGILTAMEAAGLNLWGTKLVVLSACDTGVGEVKNGDGVYGLRRALALAGAETQVMSLWPVSDQGTRDLMIEYYRALQAGQGRGEALRRVQLKLLSNPERLHPYYWASFIQSGEWANLEGRR